MKNAIQAETQNNKNQTSSYLSMIGDFVGKGLSTLGQATKDSIEQVVFAPLNTYNVITGLLKKHPNLSKGLVIMSLFVVTEALKEAAKNEQDNADSCYQGPSIGELMKSLDEISGQIVIQCLCPDGQSDVYITKKTLLEEYPNTKLAQNMAGMYVFNSPAQIRNSGCEDFCDAANPQRLTR